MAKQIQSQSTALRPLDLVTRDPWDKALFTTYALSLSFYETQLHKLGLWQNGCRDIQVVADVDGYQLSLSERQPYYVGTEFRLTPAALPNGVFHSKVVWLSGKEHDQLLLGSGNLTFGGFGKNVECLEVFRSDLHPEIFADTAAMLAEWAARDDLQFGENSWISEWQRHGAQWQRTDTHAATPRLLHSTISPIGTQLLEYAAAVGDVRSVRCLSPYYDKDAWGIVHFADQLGAKNLIIGLLPGREEKGAFPFSASLKSPLNLEAAIIEAPEDKRQLHAKIVEIEMMDGASLVMTGSVNATRKSLLTTDNIETAILRYYPAGEKLPFTWTPASIPVDHIVHEFTKAGLNQRVTFSASLNGEGRLSGRMLSSSDPTGQWNGQLQRRDGRTYSVKVDVDSQGRFSSSVEEVEQLIDAIGLQLELEKDGISGSGWVSLEELLRSARTNFISPSTTIRLLGTDADEGDIGELLKYLAVNAHRHIAAFAGRRQNVNKTNNGQESSERTPALHEVPVSELLIDHSTESHQDTPQNSQHGQVLDQLIRRILENLQSRKSEVIQAEEIDDVTSDKQRDKERKERERTTKAYNATVDDFHERMERHVHAQSSDKDCCGVLCIWLEGGLIAGHHQTGSGDATRGFLNRWKTHALENQRASKSSSVLIEHYMEVILTLAAFAANQPVSDNAGALSLSRLHEELEEFCDGSTPGKIIEESEILETEKDRFVFSLLDALPTRPDLSDTLDKILASPTPKQQMEAILACVGREEPTEEEIPLLRLEEGKELLKIVQNGRQPKFGVVESDVCPVCHVRLSKSTYHRLHARRFGKCTNLYCGAFLRPKI